MTFNVNKPKNVAMTLARTAQMIRNSGGYFSGDETSGNFSGNGVEGRYEVRDRIKIYITKKPFFYPASVVESHIRDYFRSA